MKALRLFIDTHDARNGTFPAELTEEQFGNFYAEYQDACRTEDVIPIRVDLGLEDGRAFCINLAASEDAVRRAHERVGLPFDTITEVKTISPQSLAVAASARQ